MQTLWNVRVTQQRPKSAKKRHFYGWRKNTHINELACVISDDFYVFFRVVKHSKKILADNQLFTGLRDGSPGLSLGTPPSALRSAYEIVSSSKRYMQEDGRYWGRRAWANSTRSIGFDSIHRGSAMTLRCLYLLGKMLQKGAEIWSFQKHLYQQVSRRSYKQVFRKITKIPILKSANSWYPVI